LAKPPAHPALVEGRDQISWYEKGKPNPVRYQSNCPKIPTYNQHHILPGTSMQESIDIVAGGEGKENFRLALEYFTKWNINDSHNLIALPGVKTYRALYGDQGLRQGPIERLAMAGLMFVYKDAKRVLADIPGPGSLPCHQYVNWGHTLYNVEVEADLMEVWGQVTIEMKECKLSSNDISGALTEKENTWRDRLTSGRNPTLENWRATMAHEGEAYNQFTMVELESSPI
jgi:hypothetical protein